MKLAGLKQNCVMLPLKCLIFTLQPCTNCGFQSTTSTIILNSVAFSPVLRELLTQRCDYEGLRKRHNRPLYLENRYQADRDPVRGGAARRGELRGGVQQGHLVLLLAPLLQPHCPSAATCRALIRHIPHMGVRPSPH